MSAYTIFDIANWFLQRRELDQKATQKLCYYAQAWGLAMTDRRIMDEVFEAWAHGPVNRKLWKRLTDYGMNYILKNEFDGIANPVEDEDTLYVLNEVDRVYGDWDGLELEMKTHSEAPWIKARERGGVSTTGLEPSQEIILDKDMIDYYRPRLQAV